MNKLNPSKIIKSVKTDTVKHSPEILTGLGIVGMVTATVMAVKATPKALQLIEAEKEYRESENETEEEATLTKAEIVKVAWKPYIPTIVTSAVSITCLIGASAVSAKRNATLATAYTLSQTALTEYQKKVVETVGEKKERTIRDKVAKEQIEKKPVKSNEIIYTQKGDTLCFDPVSGRYFKSDIEKIKKAVNELNSELMREMYISLNDFYYEVGLSSIQIGDNLGWNVDDGLMDVDFSAQLAEDGTPCLVMEYSIAPRYDFTHLL